MPRATTMRRKILLDSPEFSTRRASVVKRSAKMDMLLHENKSKIILLFAKANKRLETNHQASYAWGFRAFFHHLKACMRYEENRRKSQIRIESQQLLKLQAQSRTPAQIKTLMEWMINAKVFPKDLPNETLQILCTKMGSLQMEEGEVLFLQEDPGDRFYIILEGSIRLAIQNQPETVVRMRLERDSYPEKFCKEDWLRDGDIGKILKDLDKGTAFGELSMINNYQNRTTSCFCCSDTAQLCVVDKSLYEDTLKLYHSNKADHMTISKTLMSFPLFTAWNHETIQDLSDKMSIRTFQRGFKVGAKRKPFKMLTVVVKGEVVIVGGRGTDAILSRVGPGGIVGDIELYNGIKNHCLDSVVNSSECVCYQVHKEDFVGATKYDTETNERMRSHANDKMKFHSERWRIERKKERKRKRGGAGEKEEKVKGSVDLNLGILDKN